MLPGRACRRAPFDIPAERKGEDAAAIVEDVATRHFDTIGEPRPIARHGDEGVAPEPLLVDELAQDCRVVNGRLNNWEAGHARLSVQTYWGIARFRGVKGKRWRSRSRRVGVIGANWMP